MELSVEQALPPATLLTSDQHKRGGKLKLSREQWSFLILLSVGNFGLALCSGLQAPFFPREAEMKGATPSEYGLVFGLFYLTTFIFSPVFGKLMAIVGPDQLRDSGMFIVGICFILFGFLDKSPPGMTFLYLAYIVRIVEGIGCAAYKTSNFAILAALFPNQMATAMGALETMFGVGLIIGPTAGGFLYEVGGYTLPFALSGSILVVIAIMSVIVLPGTIVIKREGKKLSMIRFVMDPLVVCYILLLTISSMMIGFNIATLEPHLRQFNLTPVEIGLVFVLSGGFYGIASVVWGRLVDKQYNPTRMTCISCSLMAISFTIIGPAPFLPFGSTLWLIGVSLVLVGSGYGATRVLPFVDCLRHGVDRGFEGGTEAYGMISGIFNGTFGIGFFIGPTVGGLCIEYLGYRLTSFLLGVLGYIMCLAFVAYAVYEANKHPARVQRDKTPLLEVSSSDEHRKRTFGSISCTENL